MHIVYCNSAKFHQYHFICLERVAHKRNTDRRTDRVIPINPQRTLFVGWYKKYFLNLFTHSPSII